MREVRNVNTGRVRLVPDATAQAIRSEKWLIKQGWVVVEHKAPPHEVIKFQEAQQVTEILPEKPYCQSNAECCKTEPKEVITEVKEPVNMLTSKQVAAMINEFTNEELTILAGDPRKSVSGLAKKKLNG